MFSTYVKHHRSAYQSVLALAKKTNYTTYNPSTRIVVEYLMNQVSHHQVNQQLNIASIGSGASAHLDTHDDSNNDLEMPLICYSPKEWAQLLFA